MPRTTRESNSYWTQIPNEILKPCCGSMWQPSLRQRVRCGKILGQQGARGSHHCSHCNPMHLRNVKICDRILLGIPPFNSSDLAPSFPSVKTKLVEQWPPQSGLLCFLCFCHCMPLSLSDLTAGDAVSVFRSFVFLLSAPWCSRVCAANGHEKRIGRIIDAWLHETCKCIVLMHPAVLHCHTCHTSWGYPLQGRPWSPHWFSLHGTGPEDTWHTRNWVPQTLQRARLCGHCG